MEDVPKELLPYLETVRKASEWEQIGFKVNLNEFGLPIREGGNNYVFSVARVKDKVVADAIKTGKKALRHPGAVFEYVQAGCALSDFANLPEDIEYCMGKTLRPAGDLEEALPHLHNAVTLNPNEVRYFEVYFPLRIQLGDLSAIREELHHYRNDMDSAVHSGRFDEWLKVLIKAQEYDFAKNVISATESALYDLVKGRVTNRLYGTQKSSWYEYKLEQFQKKAHKYLEGVGKWERKKKSPQSKQEKATNEALSGSDVGELIYNFTQRCFIGEKDFGDVDLSYEDTLFKRLMAGPITQVDAHQLPSGQRQVFRELLKQYIIFLEMNKQLPFPPDFLVGSDQDILGTNLLEYVCRYKWPFPQILSRYPRTDDIEAH